jgi:hypothetical protein
MPPSEHRFRLLSMSLLDNRRFFRSLMLFGVGISVLPTEACITQPGSISCYLLLNDGGVSPQKSLERKLQATCQFLAEDGQEELYLRLLWLGLMLNLKLTRGDHEIMQIMGSGQANLIGERPKAQGAGGESI